MATQERTGRVALMAALLTVLVAFAWMAGSPGSAPAAGGVQAVPVATFKAPTDVRSEPGSPDLLFVVERGTRIEVLDDGVKASEPFLDIESIVLDPGDPGGGGEQGLLSLAFPPDHSTSGLFYVLFTNLDGDVEIDEFRRSAVDPLRALPGTRRTLLVIPHREAQNHNGGALHFSQGGLLYASIGDGGRYEPTGEHARNLDVLLGKMLRINPRPRRGQPYRIPAANPFVGEPGRDEIFAYGLRNPWRFSFDGARLALADVGAGKFEEVNFLNLADAAGANFGWPQYEAFEFFDETRPGPHPPTFPVLAYRHDPECSVIGGYVIRDQALAGFGGRYLYADFCTGVLRTFRPRANGAGGFEAFNDRPLGPTLPKVSTFGRDAAGRIYVAQISGQLSRLEPASP